MNNINVIAPYKLEGIWIFDDARVGLEKPRSSTLRARLTMSFCPARKVWSPAFRRLKAVDARRHDDVENF
jgi:hypothetical protein